MLQISVSVSTVGVFPSAVIGRNCSWKLRRRNGDIILRVIGHDNSNFAKHIEIEHTSNLVLDALDLWSTSFGTGIARIMVIQWMETKV